MLESEMTSLMNRWLRNNPWACDQLRQYTGKVIVIRIIPLINIMLAITAQGGVKLSNTFDCIDATLEISPLSLPGLVAGEVSAFDQIKIIGDAKIAAIIIAIVQQIDLNAHIAGNISNLTGDITAHRLEILCTDLLCWQAAALTRVPRIISEYLSEEKNYLTKRTTTHQFVEQLQTLQQNIDQLEQRLARLSRHGKFQSPS